MDELLVIEEDFSLLEDDKDELLASLLDECFDSVLEEETFSLELMDSIEETTTDSCFELILEALLTAGPEQAEIVKINKSDKCFFIFIYK